MIYKAEINGIPVEAYYSEENINHIFLPLLQKLTDLYEEKGKRILVMLAAPPGAGKSTLLHFLRWLSQSKEDIREITTIGMDGFHHMQDYLDSHRMMRNGKDYFMKEFKGAPETFDFLSLKERLKSVLEEEECGWPEYYRIAHNPIDNAITVKGDIVLIEGNYLLLNWDGWKDLSDFADYTVKIIAEESLLKNRLVERKAKAPMSYEEAEAFVERSDLYNVRTCLRDSKEADLTLELQADNSYKKNISC